jgi:hypothetical protein
LQAAPARVANRVSIKKVFFMIVMSPEAIKLPAADLN